MDIPQSRDVTCLDQSCMSKNICWIITDVVMKLRKMDSKNSSLLDIYLSTSHSYLFCMNFCLII